MAILMDGKQLAKKIRTNLKKECEELKEKGINPKFAVIMVGNDSASKIYVRSKSRACEEIGIEFEEFLLGEDTTQEKLENLIEELNQNKKVHGILVQSPIPKHLDVNRAFEKIAPEKDVDGFNSVNVGKLALNRDTFVSCTPYGIMKIFEEYQIDLTGKEVVIIGRSNIVGKPLIPQLLSKNATVTVCHSKTKNIDEELKQADVIVMAIGKAKFLKKEQIKKGAILIDVGINFENGKIVGDIDYEDIKEKASMCTPVPGGIGTVTNALLIDNIITRGK